MRPKNKSFIEDIFVLFIIGILIYAIYSFFFSKEETPIENQNNTIIKNKLETQNEGNSEEEEKKIEDLVEEKEEVISQKLQTNISESQKEILEQTNMIMEAKKLVEEGLKKEKIQDRPIETKPIEVKTTEITTEQVNDLNDEKARIEQFYQTIREKINSNIDKSSLKAGEYINIRLTILKDGKYEQLTLMDGNKEYFESIKPAIYKAFPIQIETSMKNNFPRYFRMKIEF